MISYCFPNGSKRTHSKCYLTLMDALVPTSVPHDPVHVPIVAKNVRGKIFDVICHIN